MNVTTVCPGCKSSFHVDSAFVGKAQSCPQCKTLFVVESHVKSRYGDPATKPALPPPDPGIAAALGMVMPTLGAFYARQPAIAVALFVFELILLFLSLAPTSDPHNPVVLFVRFIWATFHAVCAVVIYFDAMYYYKHR